MADARYRLLPLFLLSFFFFGGVRSQPKLEVVGGTAFDFGELWTTSAKKLLTLKNKGRKTLTITNVSASCGCTGTLLSEDHIAPGDSGTLSITFDASRFSGVVEKYVAFQTNDTTNKKVNIMFHANVKKTLEFDPAYFYFSTYPDSTATKELTVKNSSDTPIRITGVTSTSKEFSITIPEGEIAPGESVDILGTLKTSAAGTARGEIILDTDHPRVPRFTIRYFALVKGRK